MRGGLPPAAPASSRGLIPALALVAAACLAVLTLVVLLPAESEAEWRQLTES